MQKSVHDILQKVGRYHFSSKIRYFRLSTNRQQKPVESSHIEENNKIENYILVKLNKIPEEKQKFLIKKRIALLWYKQTLDKMISPLIPFLPDITASPHFKNITDFRLSNGLLEQSGESKIEMTVAHPKCLEEPLPIFIKPEYKELQRNKSSWKIVTTFSKVANSKNNMVKRYKTFRNKFIKESEKQKKSGKSQMHLVYNLFLKEAVESKIANLMPTIKSKNDRSLLCDFKYRNYIDSEKSKSYVLFNEEIVASKDSTLLGNSNLKKCLNHSKTMIGKSLHNNVNKKTNKTLLNTSSKFKNDDVKVLSDKLVDEERENKHRKIFVHRPLHQQNRTKNDPRNKYVKSETVNVKPVSRQIVVSSINKYIPPEVLNIEKRISGESVCGSRKTEQQITKSDKLVDCTTGFENITTSIIEKGIAFKLSDKDFEQIQNTSHDVSLSGDNKYLGSEASGKGVHDIIDKASPPITPLKPTDSPSDLQLFSEEPTKSSEAMRTSWNHVSVSHGNDIDESIIQTMPNDCDDTPKVKIEDVVKNKSHEKELQLGNPNRADELPEVNKFDVNENLEEPENTITELTNTYLVSLQTKEDEVFFKTRSQVIDQGIKGDLVDLNTVLEAEKKLRESDKQERSPETVSRCSENIILVNTSNQEFVEKNNLLNSNCPRESKENQKTKILLTKKEDFLSEPLVKNSINSKNVNFLKPNSAHDTYKNSQKLKETHILNIKRNKEILSDLNKTDFKNITSLTQKGCKTVINLSMTKPRSNNKGEQLDNSEKYQEITNAVKQITQSATSHAGFLGTNSSASVLTGNNSVKNVNDQKNYGNTINHLKEIINGLPECGHQQKSTKVSGIEKRKINKMLCINSDNRKGASNIQSMQKKHNSINKKINLKAIKIIKSVEGIKPLSSNKYIVNYASASRSISEDTKSNKIDLNSDIYPTKNTTSIQYQKVCDATDKFAKQTTLTSGDQLKKLAPEAKSLNNGKMNGIKGEKMYEQPNQRRRTSNKLVQNPTLDVSVINIKNRDMGGKDPAKDISFVNYLKEEKKSNSNRSISDAKTRTGSIHKSINPSHPSHSIMKENTPNTNSEVAHAISDLKVIEKQTNNIENLSQNINTFPAAKQRGMRKYVSVTGARELRKNNEITKTLRSKKIKGHVVKGKYNNFNANIVVDSEEDCLVEAIAKNTEHEEFITKTENVVKEKQSYEKIIPSVRKLTNVMLENVVKHNHEEAESKLTTKQPQKSKLLTKKVFITKDILNKNDKGSKFTKLTGEGLVLKQNKVPSKI